MGCQPFVNAGDQPVTSMSTSYKPLPTQSATPSAPRKPRRKVPKTFGKNKRGRK